MMKLFVIVLALVVVGQWIALAEISADSSCPVTAIAQENSVSSGPTVDALKKVTNQAKPAAAYGTGFGTETKMKTTGLYSPAIDSSVADRFSVSAENETATSKDNNRIGTFSPRQLGESLKKFNQSLKRPVPAADWIVLGALIASLLVFFLWKRRHVQSVTPPASSLEIASEVLEDRQRGSWMIEINIDDSTRQAIFRAVRYMGLRVLRRGKYSLSLGSYPNKIEASRIVQKLHKRYGVRGWLVEAPDRPAQSDRYSI